MKNIEQFEKLAAIAAADSAPTPDVASAVLRRVRLEATRASQPTSLLETDGVPLWSIAAALLVVGSVTALIGFGSWTEWNGSVYAWLPDFSSWRYL